MQPLTYSYIGYVTEIINGDSFLASIDIGLDIILTNRRIKLNGVEAPQLIGDDADAGIVAKDVLKELIFNKKVLLKIYKNVTDEYGRYIADVFFNDVFVNEYMVTNGFAKKL
ncbi:MAG: thermonuclease family protein [Candidatus Bathyarchaeota archaeon]|nr:thermonuclease family protein [Candidatus Bathyarchaeota archaeon]